MENNEAAVMKNWNKEADICALTLIFKSSAEHSPTGIIVI